MDFLYGYHLVNKQGKFIAIEEALKKASTLIYYFTAQWCKKPICDETLKLLKLIYRESRKRKNGFEIIFVSSDTEEKNFVEFFKTQGEWLAVPFKSDLAEILRQVYSVTSIPTIVVVRKTGELITKTGNQELIDKGINVLVTWDDN